MTKLPNPVELSVSVRPDWPTFVSELRRMADAIETQAEAARECADASAGGASATERHSSYDFTPCPTDPGRYSIAPRTVPAPAEPEDPRVAVVRGYYDDAGIGSSDLGIRDLLARLDAARADQ